MFDDEKIRLIEAMPEADSILLIWIRLLVLAGKTNDDGLIYIQRNMPYTIDMLTTLFGRKKAIVKLAVDVLAKFDMIDVNSDGLISIKNWEKHQNIEGMERVRKLTTERVKKYREREKVKKIDSNVTVTLRNATDSDSESDSDTDTEDKPLPPKKSTLSEDFEKLWSLYPRKERKKVAFDAYKRAIKKGVTNKQIQDGIVAYKKFIEVKKTEKEYIAQGGTWFNQERWTDKYDLTPDKKKRYNSFAGEEDPNNYDVPF